MKSSRFKNEACLLFTTQKSQEKHRAERRVSGKLMEIYFAWKSLMSHSRAAISSSSS